jgi:FMN phosphatase YigB (HAD superfamily)
VDRTRDRADAGPGDGDVSIEAVAFDVGETLVDETRVWSMWADWLGVPRFTLMSVMGSVVERDEHHQRVFDYFRDDFDVEAAYAARRAAGVAFELSEDDLYADVAACFRELSARGYRLAIAGNQPGNIEAPLRAIGLPVELVASSATWGVEKPSLAFFARLADELKLEPDRIAYVGDRLDNDVIPAREAGMVSVLIRRGPWGYIHARRPEAALADIRIESLAGLPPALAAWNETHREGT